MGLLQPLADIRGWMGHNVTERAWPKYDSTPGAACQVCPLSGQTEAPGQPKADPVKGAGAPGRNPERAALQRNDDADYKMLHSNSPFCLAAPEAQRPGQGRGAPKGSLDASRYNGTAQAGAGKHLRRSSPGEPPPERRWGPAGHPNGPGASPEPPAGAAGTGGARGRTPQQPRQQRAPGRANGAAI